MPTRFLRTLRDLWNSKWAVPLFIFIFVTVIIGILRIDIPYIWNDTPYIIAHLDINFEIFVQFLKLCWYDNGGSEYRPLNNILIAAQVLLFRDSPFFPAFTSSALLGMTAVLIFFLADMLTKRRLISLGSAFLYTFSMPVITVTWNVLNKQILVSFIIVFGLLCYVKYQKEKRLVWLCLFWLVCIFGSLFRELTGIVLVTVFLSAAAEKKRDIRLLMSFPVLAFQYAFPSFLINLFFYRNLVLNATFLRGDVQDRVSVLDYDMPYRLLMLVPPSIILLGLIAMAMYILSRKKMHAITGLVIIVSGFIGFFIQAWQFVGESSLLLRLFLFLNPLLLCLFISLVSFRFGKLLSVWFMASWVPARIISGLDVHLIPALIPLTIIILLWVAELPHMSFFLRKEN